MSFKCELRGVREAQGAIEKLGDFHDGAERQEGQAHRGPEGLQEAVGFSRQLLLGGKENRNIYICPGGHWERQNR